MNSYPPRVALYGRHSTVMQTATSSADQAASCMRLVDYLGGTVVATYLDPEQSGYRRDRPGLIKLLRDIETGAVHLVVCEALDRLALDAEDVHSVDVSPCATAHCRKRDVFRDLSAITFRDCDATKLT